MNNEDLKLLEFFEKDWEHQLENNPEMATFYGDHRYDDRLTDESEEFINKEYNYQINLLEELNKFDYQKLSEENKLNYKLFKLKTEENIESYKYKPYYMPINQLHGIHNYFSRMIEMMEFKNEKDYEKYLSRLNAIPNKIKQVIDLMEKGIKNNLTVPTIAMLDVPNQISRQLVKVEDSLFYAPLKKDIVSNELRSKIEESIKDNLYRSFEKLKDYIKTKYIPSCRKSIGLSELPNGKEYYNFLLKEFTTTNLTAEEIHNIGLKEVERIFAEIKNTINKIGFIDYEEFLEYLQYDKRFYFKTEEELLINYRDFAKRVDKELPRFFKVLPRLTYGIEKVPDYQAPSCPAAYYMPPDFNMTRAGIFYANTYQLETRPKYELEALTLHEAVPGHHLQIALSLELENLPKFRRVSKFTAYIEGWGLYSEKLGEEMGFYKNIYSKFGQLSFEIWRACRLVVDTGIHAFSWSREKAIEYLQNNTGKVKEACEVEIDRYIVLPGQAVSYKIGELKILELRKKAEEFLRDKFDIREFHHIILKDSSLPLTILEEKVLNYINNC